MNVKNVSSFSLFCFFLLFTLKQLTLATPMFYAKEAGTAAWISVIIVSLIIFLFIYIINKLYTNNFKGKNIFDISKFIGGKILYKINCLIYFFIFSLLSIVFLKEISEGIKLLLFNTTPLFYLQLFYITAMYVGAINGIEGIIRASGYIVPVCFILLSIILALSGFFFNFDNIFPILGNGIEQLLTKSITLLPSYLSVLIILFTVPHVINKTNIKKSILSYIIIGSCFTTFTILSLTLVFGFPYTQNNLFSFYELANITNATRFFKISEAIYLFSTLVLGLMFLMTLFFFSSYCFKLLLLNNNNSIKNKAKNNIFNKLFKNKYLYNLLLIITIVFLCNIPENIFQTFIVKEYLNKYLILPFVFVYPILLLIIANMKLRLRKGKI